MGLALFVSCNNEVRSDENRNIVAENKILQQKDGTISLKIDKAECYHDMVNPSSNTAEWNVVVSKSGRYNVWLSSATKDTTDLKYKNSVLLSIRDNRFETLPIVNRWFKTQVMFQILITRLIHLWVHCIFRIPEFTMFRLSVTKYFLRISDPADLHQMISQRFFQFL